jgi:TrmH family RNA methyltransferase
MTLSKNEIKFARSILQKKFRDLEGLFVVEGVKMVKELVEQDQYQVRTIYSCHPHPLEYPKDFEVKEISQSDLERISAFKNPNRVLALVEMGQPKHLDPAEENLILLLDEVKDPGNLGTIIRTADWFGVTQIVCSLNTVDHFNPKVIQASMGAIFRMKVIYQDLITCSSTLINNGFQLLGADMNGENAFNYQYPRKTALIMGSESHGLSKQLEDMATCITIPKIGKSESLNVGMAAGILMAKYVNNR